jgi:hypothetical protein
VGVYGRPFTSNISPALNSGAMRRSTSLFFPKKDSYGKLMEMPASIRFNTLDWRQSGTSESARQPGKKDFLLKISSTSDY